MKNDMEKTFKKKVIEIVKKIEPGRTLSYKEVATKAGNPRAGRVVGNIMKANQDPDVPCHRVILSNGSLGGYNQGKEIKKKLIEKEKIQYGRVNK